MINFRAKFYLIFVAAIVTTQLLPRLAMAADGDDFSTSTDYYLNQRRFGGTEMRATSDDYEITGILGEPADGLATSDDYLFNSGTIWRTTGALSISIVDSSYDAVVAPSVPMGDVTFSFTSQTATGSLGENEQRVYWENFDAADTSGYNITIAATDGLTDKWDGPAATDYDFNDNDGDTDGADDDAFGGQLTIDPSVGALTARSGYGTTTGISLNVTPTAFNETVGPVSSITLITASGASDDYHAAYATGIGLSQEIPASQAVDTYTINMTLTIA